MMEQKYRDESVQALLSKNPIRTTLSYVTDKNMVQFSSVLSQVTMHVALIILIKGIQISAYDRKNHTIFLVLSDTSNLY